MIESIPGIGPYIPWITLAVTVASVLAACMPPPSPTSGPVYVTIYNVVHFVAQNYGRARAANRPPPPPTA